MSNDSSTQEEKSSIFIAQKNNDEAEKIFEISSSNIVVNKKSTNRNKNVTCLLCGKWMRNDHLQRHMKIRKDLTALDDQELRVELKNASMWRMSEKKIFSE